MVSQIVHDGVLACRSCAYTGMTTARQKCIERKRIWRTPEEKDVLVIMRGAKSRCTNLRKADYANYGGRGITFDFASPEDATRWVLENLGPRPAGMSIDRINNDAGYAPNNLRWADSTTQRVNQRPIPKTGANFHRLSHLAKLRPDYSWESLRQFVARGLTDDEIINRKKGKHYGLFIGQNLRHR
jgi:hypothetical protein